MPVTFRTDVSVEAYRRLAVPDFDADVWVLCGKSSRSYRPIRLNFSPLVPDLKLSAKEIIALELCEIPRRNKLSQASSVRTFFTYLNSLAPFSAYLSKIGVYNLERLKNSHCEGFLESRTRLSYTTRVRDADIIRKLHDYRDWLTKPLAFSPFRARCNRDIFGPSGKSQSITSARIPPAIFGSILHAAAAFMRNPKLLSRYPFADDLLDLSSLITVIALTGMRSGEAFSLKRGCTLRNPRGDGWIFGNVSKGPGAPRPHKWAAPSAALDAVETQEQRVTSDWIFARIDHFRREAGMAFKAFANSVIEDGRLCNKDGVLLERIPEDWLLKLRQFRPTIARCVSETAGGIVTCAVQFAHRDLSVTEKYAGRPGFEKPSRELDMMPRRPMFGFTR